MWCNVRDCDYEDIREMIKKIKLLFLLWKLVKMIKGGKMKNGLKTSEFWLTTGSGLLTLTLALLGQVNPALAIKIITILTAVYTAGRTLVKVTATDLDDKAIEKLGEVLASKK